MKQPRPIVFGNDQRASCADGNFDFPLKNDWITRINGRRPECAYYVFINNNFCRRLYWWSCQAEFTIHRSDCDQPFTEWSRCRQRERMQPSRGSSTQLILDGRCTHEGMCVGAKFKNGSIHWRQGGRKWARSSLEHCQLPPFQVPRHEYLVPVVDQLSFQHHGPHVVQIGPFKVGRRLLPTSHRFQFTQSDTSHWCRQ